MSLYQEIILDHYRNPRNHGTIKNPTRTAFLYNPLCGDRITIDVIVDNGTIKDIVFSGSGCVISQAAASLLTDHVKNKKISSLLNLDQSAILYMLGIKLGPVRLQCALLPLQVLRNITQQL